MKTFHLGPTKPYDYKRYTPEHYKGPIEPNNYKQTTSRRPPPNTFKQACEAMGAMETYKRNINKMSIKTEVYDHDIYRFKTINWDRKPEYIIDIGANVGWFTTLAAENEPDAKIYSYELMKENYDKAKGNLSKFSNVEVFNKVIIGENAATKYMRAPRNSGGHRALYENEDTYISEKRYKELIWEKDERGGSTLHDDLPEQISLKQIIEDNDIDYVDFLKIDCEGCEHELLLHMFKHDIDKKILNMALEVHGRTWDEWPKIVKTLKERFDDVTERGRHLIFCRNNCKDCKSNK